MFAYNKIIVFTKGQYYISRHMNHNSIIVKQYDSKKQLSQYQFAYVLHEVLKYYTPLVTVKQRNFINHLFSIHKLIKTFPVHFDSISQKIK